MMPPCPRAGRCWRTSTSNSIGEGVVSDTADVALVVIAVVGDLPAQIRRVLS
jgi:hypothetical protein